MYGDECRAKCSLEWWHSNTEHTGDPWLHQQLSTEKLWAIEGDRPMEAAVMWAVRSFCDHDPEKIVAFLAYVLQQLGAIGWVPGYEKTIEGFYDNCKAAHEAHEAIEQNNSD